MFDKINEEKVIHIPVLLKETIETLNIFPGMNYLDCTIGYGGHFSAVLKKAQDKGMFYGFDQDITAFNYCKNRFKDFNNVFLFHTNFASIKQEIGKEIYFDSILMDLGISSLQIEEQNRGFSYHLDAKLDMRMNQNQKLDAYYVINFYPRNDLIWIFKEYGEVNKAEKVADLICKMRKIKPITTTFELRDLIYEAEYTRNINRKNPVKQYFQALRIYVNDEINVLKNTLKEIAHYLRPNGVLAVITFHSLEDKIVKDIFHELSTSNPVYKHLPIMDEKVEYILLTKKPILPSEEEIKYNLKSHSAKLRAIRKI